MSDHQRASTNSAPRQLIDSMLGAAGAHSTDRIAIAGPRIELLIGVLHRGFASARCIAAEAPAGSEPFDILLISDIDAADALCRSLPRLARRLSAGGAVVLREPSACPIRYRRMLRRTLQDCGLTTVTETAGPHGTLLAARKLDAVWFDQVA
jgi:hypothetical protein